MTTMGMCPNCNHEYDSDRFAVCPNCRPKPASAPKDKARVFAALVISLVTIGTCVGLSGGLMSQRTTTDLGAPGASAASSANLPAPPAANAPAATTPEPQPVPTHAVGDVFDLEGNKMGVIGAKLVDNELAVRIYVKSTIDGADLSDFGSANFRVVNTDGSSYAGDIAPGDLADLDTSTLVSLEGDESTNGWIGFPVNGATDQLVLVVDSPSGGSATVSLDGATHAPPKNPAAKALVADKKAEEAAYEASTVTMNDYHRVKHGMSLRAVQKILGYKGEEVSSSGGFSMRSWSNDFDGSNMIVTFYHGRVQSKAQAGL